jgi:hypothetical protein
MQVMETERQTQGVMVVAVVVLLKMVCLQNKLHIVSRSVYTKFLMHLLIQGIGVVVLHVVQRKPKYLLTCLMERIQRGVLLAMVLMRCYYSVISYLTMADCRVV